VRTGPAEQRGGAARGCKHCSALIFFRSFLQQGKKEQEKLKEVSFDSACIASMQQKN